MNQNNSELAQFINLKNQFINQAGGLQIDEFGFTTADKPDVLILGLTHGNEVIGLQVINLFLEKILDLKHNFTGFSFAILLNNLKAFHANQRFMDKDLNRCFMAKTSPAETTKNPNYELDRALQIESLIKKLKPRFIIDLHQISQPTLSPFFMVPEDSSLIHAAYEICANWPIIAFSTEGFSNEGKTLTEFARHEKIPALVIEISQNGYNYEIASSISENLMKLKVDSILNFKPSQKLEYYMITETLINHDLDLELNPGFCNLQPVKENELLGQSPNGQKLLCPKTGVFIFPKYGRQTSVPHELGFIATVKV